MSELADEHDLGYPRNKAKLNDVKQLLIKFLKSRRQGISSDTITFYNQCISPLIEKYPLTAPGITLFLNQLKCNTGGKLAYYRAIRAFCNWLVRYDYLNESPLKKIDPPKPPKPILPSLTMEEVDYLITQVSNLRDKAIISLFADSGIRLKELVNIKPADVDLDNYTITIWGKGNKQRKAPFTNRTADLFKQLLQIGNPLQGNIWGIQRRGVETMLHELKYKTGLPCNPHTFRRTFASNLHRAGLDIEHIMRLGGWESLDMVIRYTRSVKFEDSLKLYHQLNMNN